MQHECKIEEWTTQPTMSIRTRSSLQAIGKTLSDGFGRIMEYLGELGEHPTGAPYTAYFNEDMDDLDIEIGVQVSKKLPGRGDIESGEMPHGQVATCLHTGPYAELRPAYESLSKWVAEHGYDAHGVAYEVYIDDPAQVAPAELKTIVAFPLKAAERQIEQAG